VTVFRCLCGRAYKIEQINTKAVPLGGDWETRQMRDYAVGAEVGPGVEYERTQPIGRMNMISDVTTPLAWSFVTAVLVGVASLVVVFLSQGSRFALSPWAAVAVFIIVLILSWFIRSDLATKLLYITERITGQDLNGDDTVGEPQRYEIAFTEQKAGGLWMGLVPLPRGIDPSMAQTWARAVMTGTSPTVGRWTGTGKMFTRGQYDEFCDHLVNRGLLREGRGNTPRSLTKKGQAAFGEFVTRRIPQ